VPVKVLLIEPTWKSVSGVTGSGFSTLVTPNPAVCSLPLCQIPTATPGMDSRFISEIIFCDTFLKFWSLMFDLDAFIYFPLFLSMYLQTGFFTFRQ
jgi:hypothetical protein